MPLALSSVASVIPAAPPPTMQTSVSRRAGKLDSLASMMLTRILGMRGRLLSLSLCLRAGANYLRDSQGHFLKYVAIPAITVGLSWRAPGNATTTRAPGRA